MKTAMWAALAIVTASYLGAGPATAAVQTGIAKVQSQPSFNCSRARTRVEHLICGDAYLSQLDRRMANAYAAFQRRISAAERTRLREDQRLWLADRNRCTDVDCLVATYEDRIAYLNGSGRY